MSSLEKLACMQKRRGEVLNQELAKELAQKNDKSGIKEIAENLQNKDKNIQNDCIKVLYEIGYLKPELINDFVLDFIQLLSSKNNRLVWGGMIALAVVAEAKPKEIYDNLSKINRTIEQGSVITVDNGIKVLAKVATSNVKYSQEILPYLMNHLKSCRPKDVPQHSEHIFCAINSDNKKEYLNILNERMDILSKTQSARVKRLIKKVEGL